MGKTKIPWADEVWNVTTGCSYASEGCTRCYAERMAKRQVAMGFWRHEHHAGNNDDTWIAYSNAIDPDTGKWSGEITCRYEKLDEPFHWRKPRRVFVNSMSDLFHKNVPNRFIESVWLTVFSAPQHTFLILTKRPGRMLTFMDWYGGRHCVNPSDPDLPYPNIWLGVSAENQKRFDERYDYLRRTPAAIRFMSLEPLLGPIDMTGYVTSPHLQETWNNPQWIVVGAESGPNARPMDPDWARDVRDQCRAAGVPFFMKQMSGRVPIPDDLMIREWPDG